MNLFFRRIPLPAKLMLVGFIPLAFLVYLSAQLYAERAQKVNLLKSYIVRMHQSADITKLIDNIQTERAYSYEYTLKKDMLNEMMQQRPKTDSIIKRLSDYTETLSDFPSYTFLKDLTAMRTAIDSGKVNLTMVMDYYTNVIFRFNTLNTLPAGSYIYLKPLYKDLVAQKLLSEMVTYLGIMSANIYNALYTRQYMIEILMGTRGVYLVYNTYETEFLLKADPDVAQSYKKMKAATSLQPATSYLDKVFKTFSYDSTYDYIQWGKLYSAAINELRTLQQAILKNAETQVNAIYNHEQEAKRNMLIFLIIVLVLVIGIVVYTIHVITRMLKELKIAAQKISKGGTGLQFNIDSDDAIGSLAHSISEIDENNKRLADAANAIGNGDFTSPIQPRSGEDLLGNAIVRMKNNLQGYIAEIKNAQNEIAGLNQDLEKKVAERTAQLETVNKELESFTYSVSHDLRAPLRSIIGFASIFEEDYSSKLDDEAKRIISIIRTNTQKMGQLVDGLLTFSRMERQNIAKTDIDTQLMVKEVINEFASNEEHSIEWLIQPLPHINADTQTLRQVWVNLISNAIKYSRNKESPHIEIGSFSRNGQIVFFVKDNGVGFDKQYGHKLFKVFQRLHSDNEFEGTGIGLALVEKIVSKHGGKVWADAELNYGATFYFSLSVE